MVQNLTRSVAHPISTFSYAILQKLLKLVPLTETGPEVYVVTMTKFLSNSYDYLKETLKNLKCLKLKDHPEENITEFCAEILVYAKPLESYRYFNTNHLGYITNISDNTSNPIFHL